MVGKLVGQRVVGIKQTLKALKNNQGKVLYIAKDADTNITDPILKLAKVNSLQIIFVDTMKELGNLCDIDVASATALLLED
ncbi:ribosomal L7Ae/L30e/S12e/Gadd45 family protein [Clostridium tagluense]|uniref:ribosomal L7Ae/L30e/S12e/Gadd45 family protein n=1 Tax=Clostridium TaxID=1485 RepID=UPI0013E991D5|nr:MULTISPECIES: ribosomal L7Ae/L30e/S12e/Gadd45 family protein [Clostridium]MBU3128581.1 ribosomal L7Ae/L30e/S12e/Gadd45 family protein [Clostridium tagluense]MBZ9637113.1 ribosomal L7Ae/L30e/S12e/Gadd45 family protein [Clostridium sp. FP1]MCB2301020.1 ribosomal L7Ae/L30e/S12e/Gadd45 family protein [Clostridium tagluense]MCB2313295.1 ribosomal L7Ae/L30e/S12e/Gadd45 family protein [Clostridium tagluense]MCB2318061.1 ribosomal L7Ae/L30e/S12e/Gadd45 family protein [Clostridium tagluense]